MHNDFPTKLYFHVEYQLHINENPLFIHESHLFICDWLKFFCPSSLVNSLNKDNHRNGMQYDQGFDPQSQWQNMRNVRFLCKCALCCNTDRFWARILNYDASF